MEVFPALVKNRGNIVVAEVNYKRFRGQAVRELSLPSLLHSRDVGDNHLLGVLLGMLSNGG